VQFLGISKKLVVVEASAGYGCRRHLQCKVQFLGNSKTKKPAVVATNAGRAVQFRGISKEAVVVKASAGYGCRRYLYYTNAFPGLDWSL
jgi:hypothetical protein